MKRLLVASGVLGILALALVSTALAGGLVTFKISCTDQADPGVHYALTHGFTDGGPVYTEEQYAEVAETMTFKTLVYDPVIPVSPRADLLDDPVLIGHLKLQKFCGEVFVQPPSAVYVCMKNPLPGEGHFAAVTTIQANTMNASSSDARFSLALGNATPANMSASNGATCDNPAAKYGEKDQGYLVDGSKQVDPNNDPKAAYGSGHNNLYEYYA